VPFFILASCQLPTPNSQLPKNLTLEVGSWRLGVDT
jgi:hypothetical protein